MARPRLYEEDRVVTAVRLPKALHHRLHDAAKQRQQSANALVIDAVLRYLNVESSGDSSDEPLAVVLGSDTTSTKGAR
jgi:hypothetical protein